MFSLYFKAIILNWDEFRVLLAIIFLGVNIKTGSIRISLWVLELKDSLENKEVFETDELIITLLEELLLLLPFGLLIDFCSWSRFEIPLLKIYSPIASGSLCLVKLAWVYWIKSYSIIYCLNISEFFKGILRSIRGTLLFEL